MEPHGKTKIKIASQHSNLSVVLSFVNLVVNVPVSYSSSNENHHDL